MWKGVFSVTGDAQEETDESEATVEEVQVLLKSRISCRFWVKKKQKQKQNKARQHLFTVCSYSCMARFLQIPRW